MADYADIVKSLAPGVYWRCLDASGNLVDATANGNTAVVHGAPGYGLSGPLKQPPTGGVSLPGVNTNYFEAPNSASLNVGDTLTVLAWIKLNAIGVLQRVITQAANGYDISVDSTGHLQLAKDGVGFIVTATSVLTANAWHMIAVTKAGVNTAKLYADGLLVSSADVSGVTLSAPAGITEIGRNATGGGDPFNGSIAEIAIFSTALSASQIWNLYAAAITGVPTWQLPVVVFREPEPPHGELFQCYASALKYAFRVRGMGTASFMLSRADVNVKQLYAALTRRRVPMVTIERPDKRLPWVGFVATDLFPSEDPFFTFTAADHMWRLAGGNTKVAPLASTASGYMIQDTLGEMEARQEPALYLNLKNVRAGPGVNWELRASKGESFLRDMERLTNWEAFFTYDVGPTNVATYLNWEARQGYDLRGDIYSEGKHLARCAIGHDYSKGVSASYAIGGVGDFAARPMAGVNVKGASTLGAATNPAVVRPKQGRINPITGLGGARVSVLQQVTDPNVLLAHAQQTHDAPPNAVETLTGAIVESQVDMGRIAAGNIVTVRLQQAFAGVPQERVARILGIELDPATGVHPCVFQVFNG